MNRYDLVDGATHIKKEHINLKKDLALAAKTIQVLEIYLKTLPVKTEIFYYDLFFREVYNAANNRQHNPLYTLKNFEAYFNDETYKIRHRKPVEDFSCLICDGSLHPSNLGFLSLFHVLHHQDSMIKDYDVAMRAAKANLNRNLGVSFNKLPRGTLICGDSICVSDLVEQLEVKSLEELHSRNIWIYAAFPQSTDVLENIKGLIKRHKIEHICYFSSLHSNVATDIYMEGQRIRYVLKSLCSGTVLYLPYELIAREIISRRHKDLVDFKDLQMKDWKNVLAFLGVNPVIFSDKFIQVGEFMHPYPGFYIYILSYFSELIRKNK